MKSDDQAPAFPCPASTHNQSPKKDEDGQQQQTLFVLLFSQAHAQFRRAEFESVCRICGICPMPEFQQAESYFQVVQFADHGLSIGHILGRSVLLKAAYQLLLRAPSHEALLSQIRAQQTELLEPFDRADQSWCLQVRPQGRKRDFSYVQTLIQLYAPALGLKEAPICLNDAHNKFTLFELYDTQKTKLENEERPSEVMLARFMGEGQAQLKVKFSLAQRRYIGNSTMDPELALIQANLALTRPGILAMDPFCGTGGLLLPAAYFGAHVFGVEIKWDVARAKGKSSRAGQTLLDQDQSIRANFVQYGLDNGRFLGLLLADSSQHGMWRFFEDGCGSLDAILADPPYGIRERGQKLGADSWKHKKEATSKDVATEDREKWNRKEGAEETRNSGHHRSFPEKQPYQMSSVFLDLLDLGVRLLRVGGRLVFWFPVCRSDYSERILPKSRCMRLMYNCEQRLAKDSARRLLVYEKMGQPNFDVVGGQLCPADRAYFQEDCYGQATFREKVFNS